MTDHHTPDRPGAGRYEIRLAGHLDPRWVEWFDGLDLAHEGPGMTVLSGAVGDQSALHGILGRVRDLGLPLLSVTRLDDDRVAPADSVERKDF